MPLAIVMTVCTTLAAVLLTPLLTKILAGTFVSVDVIRLSISTLQVKFKQFIDLFLLLFPSSGIMCFLLLGSCCSGSVGILFAKCISSYRESHHPICSPSCCISFFASLKQVWDEKICLVAYFLFLFYLHVVLHTSFSDVAVCSRKMLCDLEHQL